MQEFSWSQETVGRAFQDIFFIYTVVKHLQTLPLIKKPAIVPSRGEDVCLEPWYVFFNFLDD